MKAKRKLFCLLFLSISTSLGAQISPGGIGTTGLTSWFRADDLTAGNVTNWTTQYPTGASAVSVTDNQAPYPQLEITPTGAVSNYNRTIEFSGNSFAGLNQSTLQGLSNTNPPTLLTNAYSGDQGSYFCAYYLPVPTNINGHMTLYNDGTTGLQVRNLGANSRVAIGNFSSNTVNAVRNYFDGNIPNIASYKGNRSNSSSMKAFNRSDLLPTPGGASQSSGNDGLYIGYHANGNTSAYNGFIHEILFFNRDLTDLEMQKVHSYLAIKYGVTLIYNQASGSGDYIATDGTIIWDASVTPDYHNDVIGIGRDDVEELYQKQSHSFDDAIRIYIDDLVAANENNVGLINTDISYLTAGHNSGDLCGSVASNLESPGQISSRISRELKVTNTEFNQDFNFDIELNPCAPIANVDLSKLRLLVDADGDFTDASLFSQANGLTFTENNGVLTVSGISTALIPVNDTRYITIGYVDESYEINEFSGPICEGEQAWVIFNVSNSSTTVNIDYSDGTNQYTETGVVSGDTLFLSPTATTDYYFTPFPGALNCCNANNPQVFNQVVNPLPVITLDSFDDTPCDGDPMTLTANGGDTYSWNNNVVNAIPFLINLADAGVFEVTVTSAAGCINTLDTLIDVKENPEITLIDEVNEACEGDMVTLTADGAVTYDWIPFVTNGVPFLVSEGTTDYEVIGTDANGCEATLNTTMVVYSAPIAAFTPDTTSGVAPITINFTDNSTNAIDYFWDFANGNNSTFPGDETETYENGGTYPVTLTVENGICADSQTKLITLESGDIYVVLPNVFTPNGDGSNDLYKITSENVVSIEGFILNRWGSEVYSFDSIDFEWDGENVIEGVYFIKYSAEGKNGENLEGHGYIHVNR